MLWAHADSLVDFDTGSSDLFLPGPSCGATCAGHSIYDPTQSSTSSDIHKSFQLKFGDGSSVQAEAYEDVVSVAGMPAIAQALGVSSTYSTGFGIPSFPPDGLLGLGFPSISKFGQPPVFNTLIAEGILNAPAFGVYLADSGGELFLGGTNPNLYQGGFTFVPVTKEAYWQVTLDEITVDDRPVLLSTFPVIIDTGTTLLVGPPQEVAAVYAQIPGALPYVREIANGLYTIPCDFNYTLALTFGGRSFSIDPSTFNQGPADDTPGRCFAGLAFDPDLTLEGFWIIGDVFLRNVYTVFDAGSSHVGFASLAYPTS
ncbi:aspartic peptidase domain-containing protein [Gloeopeniophorella convolvens]|nr:aspartic peptidase domain-containing protein [Gloeopeniophorella convolvens]